MTNETTKTTVVDCLEYNNRLPNAKLTADQLGAEAHANWLTLINNLHRDCYQVACQCESGELTSEDTTVDTKAVKASLRFIFDSLGEVNGHKLYANDEVVIAVVNYASRRSNLDAPALQLCNSRIANKKKELKLAEGLNGLNKDYIPNLQAELDALNAEKETLLATPDMRIKQVTMTTASAFRFDFEHFLGRLIAGQKAKTLAQLDEEIAKRKAEMKAKSKARRQEKRRAEKQAQVEAQANA